MTDDLRTRNLNSSTNPAHNEYGYWYYDETFQWVGPFKTHRKAHRELLRYSHWLVNGPTRWQKIWWPVKWSLRSFAQGFLKWLEQFRYI